MRKKNHANILCSFVIGIAISVISPLGFAIDDAKEYEIKAAYIFSLGSYISWPETLFTSDNDNFTICVLGDNPPLVKTLNFIAPKRQINGRNTTILAISNSKEGDHCQIMFIDHSMKNSMKEINTWHQRRPILLVSDMERFIRLGGMIEFYLFNNKVRLAMDPETISDVGLKPSSQLMRVAQLRSR